MASLELSRRSLLAFAAAAPGFALFAVQPARAQDTPAAGAEAEGDYVTPAAGACSAEDADGMRSSLQYVEVSQFGAERDCRNCEFWSADAGAACGNCTLIEGAISPTGYCDSWALASSAAAQNG